MIGAACQTDRPRCAEPAVTENRLHLIHAPGDNFKFLVVGAGRGGTSLLAGLLDYHSELEVGFELFSVPNLLGQELHPQDSEIFHERVTAFVSACRQEANRYPTAQWGNKITTEQIHGLEDHNLANPQSKVEILDAFFNDYLKHVKVIFVLRDGRACVNSKVRRTGQPIMTACERWRYSVQCYKFLSNRHANNVCVRFEDILLHPQTVLTRVCGFLGISYEQEMLNGVRNRKMLPEYQGEKLDTAKAEPVELPDNCFRMIEDDLKYCGYI
jgi:hypothetical protein